MSQTSFYIYIAILFFITVINIATVFDISRFPLRLHKRKRYWTNVVLFFPIIGVLIYFIIGRHELSEPESGS